MINKAMIILSLLLIIFCLFTAVVIREFSNEKPIVPPDLLLSFPIEEGSPPVIEVVLGGMPWKFIIDTGASDSMISTNVEMNVGVKRYYRGERYLSSEAHYVFMRRATLQKDLIVAGSVIKGVKWALLSEADTNRFAECFDGIIGRDILSNLIISLDYGNNVGTLLGVGKRSLINTESYERISMSRKARITITIEGKKKKAMVDTGGAFTMILRKEKPTAAWSAKSIMLRQGHGIGIGAERKLVVGALPSLSLGSKSFEHVAFEEQYKLFTSVYAVLGQKFFSEGSFVFDFPSQSCYFKISDNYQLSREAGSALKLHVVASPLNAESKSMGIIKIESIHENNPLVTQYGIFKEDQITKIDDKDIIVDAVYPDISNFMSFIEDIIMLRFKTLTVQRGDSIIEILNQKHTVR